LGPGRGVSRIRRMGRIKQHGTTIEKRLREEAEKIEAQNKAIGLVINWLLSRLTCKEKISR